MKPVKFKTVDSPLYSLCKAENESVLQLFCVYTVTGNSLEQLGLSVSEISLSDKYKHGSTKKIILGE